MTGSFRENMRIVILLSSIALATQLNPPPRSVNVAIETSFLFDPKDLNDNKSLVNNIRRFLDKLYKILESQTAQKQFRTDTKPRVPEEKRLREFIEVMQNIGHNFLNMTSTKIKEALDTIHVEIKNITEKQPSLPLQILPTRTQDIIKDLINTSMNSNPDDIKIFINSTVHENKPLLKTFARRMNSYYNADDVKELNKILKKFKRYLDNNRDTTKIIKKLLHNTIFKKYDNLNESAKAAVMGDLKMLSEFLIAKNSVAGLENRRNSPSKKAEFPNNSTYKALTRSTDEKIKKAIEKNEDNKNGTNEIVANVDFSVDIPQSS